MDALAGFPLCIRPHPFPAGVVGLVLVLRLHLLGDAVKHLVGALLSLPLLLVLVHFITSWIVWLAGRKYTHIH